MKLTVKTLKGSHFEITVQPTETIMAVKKNIENVQGKDNYPCGQQLLIHSGKVLKDESTLSENKVSEDGFLVVMLSKSKTMGSSGAPSTPVTMGSSGAPFTPSPAPATVSTPDLISAPPEALVNASEACENAPEVPEQAVDAKGTPSTSDDIAANAEADVYGQAASHLAASSDLEEIIQEIMGMSGGSWDKETVTRALRAAYNNPERAVEYLYYGIPVAAEVAAPAADSTVTETSASFAAPVSGVPNSSPLNMFPQVTLSSIEGGGGLGSLDFLRNNQQFQTLRTMVQANPQILQPMLQELGKQNPELLRLIQDHHAEFLQLINEPVEGSDGEEMPHTVNVTSAEQEVIERLEAMGFDRALVIEAFLACDRNEELAVNYLLEHAGDYQD